MGVQLPSPLRYSPTPNTFWVPSLDGQPHWRSRESWTNVITNCSPFGQPTIAGLRSSGQNTPVFAREAGLSEDEIAGVAAGAHEGWHRRSNCCLWPQTSLHASTTISYATWMELSEYFTSAELVEAIYVVGQYTMLSMVANVATAGDD